LSVSFAHQSSSREIMPSTRQSRAEDRYHARSTPAASPVREEDHRGRAIVGVPMSGPSTLTSLLGQRAANDMPARAPGDERMFTIRAADEAGQRSSAGILIDRMYATRGYLTNGLPSETSSDRITLTACEHEVVMGTITVGFDAQGGLFVDELF